jgi:hypothetical protein
MYPNLLTPANVHYAGYTAHLAKPMPTMPLPLGPGIPSMMGSSSAVINVEDFKSERIYGKDNDFSAGDFICGYEEEKFDPITGEKVLVKCN